MLNLLSDIITYVRRIIKSPSNAQISDPLIIDYINRFWIVDVDARMQLFDLKSKYTFQTVPGVDRYNMPLYNVQTEPLGNIGLYPVYQGFLSPMYINGIQVGLQTQKGLFFNAFPNVPQQSPIVAVGDGGASYTFTLPLAPNNQIPINTPVNYLLRGHVDMAGIIAASFNPSGSNQDPPIGTDLHKTAGVVDIPFSSIDPAVYLYSTDVTGAPIVVSDSGQFLTTNVNEGLLMSQVPPAGQGINPFGYSSLPGGYNNSFIITNVTQAAQAVVTTSVLTSFIIGQKVTIENVLGMTQLNGNTYTILNIVGTAITLDVDSTTFTAYISGGDIFSTSNVVNYFTGEISVTFPTTIPPGVNINANYFFYQSGLPRAALFYNNVLTLRSPPDRQYVVEVDAYLTPAAFLNTGEAIQFGYMAEYLARGAARKILSDTGDVEQFQFYEPLFREQELLVWKRSQRQWTATRSETIYSLGPNLGQSGYNNQGGSTY